MVTLSDFGWQRMGTVPSQLPLVVAVVEYDTMPAMTAPAGAVVTANDPSGLLGALANRVFGTAAGARTVHNWWRECFDSELIPFMAAQPVVGPITLPLGAVARPEAERVELIKSRVAHVLSGLAADFAWADKDKDHYINLHTELPLLVFDNYTSAGGVNRAYGPGTGAMAIQGLVGSLAACGWQASLMTICHELMHVFGAVDLYGAAGLNERYSTMGPTPGGVAFEDSLYCPDPFHRLQMGVSQPRLCDVASAGFARLRTVSDQDRGTNSAALLFSSQRGKQDWFLVEYRRQERMDGDVFPGFLVWQVTTDQSGEPKIIPSLTVPNGLDRGVNLLGKPGLERGKSSPWASGDTMTLVYADGTSPGVDVMFIEENDDRFGRIVWGPTGTPLLEFAKAEDNWLHF